MLRGDFCLVTVEERVAWREALARHVVSRRCPPDGQPPAWKLAEHVRPTQAAIGLLIEQGVASVREIEDRLASPESVTRNDYAPRE